MMSCPPFPKCRHRTQAKSDPVFLESNFWAETKRWERGGAFVGWMGEGWGRIGVWRRPPVYQFLPLSSRSCPGSHPSELACTTPVPSFCAFRSARVGFGCLVTGVLGLRSPRGLALPIWPPLLPSCRLHCFLGHNQLVTASRFLPLALQPECHLLREAIADHPKTF